MNTATLFNAVMELDLEPIKSKLMHVESGEGWSLEQANAVEKEYRRFLCLMKMYPDAELGPLMDVDTFWHYHILDTMKYAVDCEKVFGYFQHHYPYVGMGDEADQQTRIDGAIRMRDLYEATFDDAYPEMIYDTVPVDALGAGPGSDKAGAHAGSTNLAFSAGPWKDKLATHAGGTNVAFSAGPWGGKAGTQASGTNVAFSAGPWKDKAGAHAGGTNVAFSAGPWQDKLGTRAGGTNIAFSAGPWNGKIKTAAAQHGESA